MPESDSNGQFFEPTPDLPDMFQAEWPDSKIQTLFSDLAQGAKIQHLQVRFRTDEGMQDRPGTLQEAAAFCRENRLVAAQIRYRFEEQDWSDTVMPATPGLFRIIRVRQQ